jgi:hypothetical protein
MVEIVISSVEQWKAKSYMQIKIVYAGISVYFLNILCRQCSVCHVHMHMRAPSTCVCARVSKVMEIHCT